MVPCIGPALRAPEHTCVFAQCDLIDALQARGAPLNGKGRRQLVAALVRNAAILLIQLMNEITSPKIERVVRMQRVIKARRAKLSLRDRGSRLPRLFQCGPGLWAYNAICLQVMIALECLHCEACRRPHQAIGLYRPALPVGITKVTQQALMLS